jgi:hypothetical protein|nr:MAG TPA: Protein of unknown function (DUF2570) [Caudoviricetes sp.]
MIILLLINILELLAIVYLLWILFEQVMNCEYLNDLHDNALNSLEKIRNERDYLRNEYRSTSETKADLLKQNDEYKNTINKIREIAKTSSDLPCADYWCNCEKCNDDITNNGETCMRKGLKRILKVVGE